MAEGGWNEEIITRKKLGDCSTSKPEHAMYSCLHAFQAVNTIFYFSLNQFWLYFPHILHFKNNTTLFISPNRSQQTWNPALFHCVVAIGTSLLHLEISLLLVGKWELASKGKQECTHQRAVESFGKRMNVCRG